MFANIVIGLLILAGFALVAYGCRCRGCKQWTKTSRVTREDGFLVTCLDCGYKEMIPWEDLH